MKTIKITSYEDIPDIRKFSGKILYQDDCIEYWHKGEWHRLDGPALEYNDGCKSYYINGVGYENEQEFYNSSEYKQWTLLENMKRIKGI